MPWVICNFADKSACDMSLWSNRTTFDICIIMTAPAQYAFRGSLMSHTLSISINGQRIICGIALPMPSPGYNFECSGILECAYHVEIEW